MGKKVRGSAVSSDPAEIKDEQFEAEDDTSEELEAAGDLELEDEDSDNGEYEGEAVTKVSARDMYPAEARSVESQKLLRDQMAREVEEFLARGGKIQVVEPNVVSDPPRKPGSSYGSRPL